MNFYNIHYLDNMDNNNISATKYCSICKHEDTPNQHPY